MGEVGAQDLQLSVIVQESKEANSANSLPDVPDHISPRRKDFYWWIRMAIYTVFVLSGQSIATLLGRQYYDKGGKSNMLATLVQLCGFPILLPLYFIPALNREISPATNRTIQPKPPSTLVLASVYACFGLLIAGDCYLYSVGLSYLPVSTYSLICASQLAFNALFSFFLNKQKFTPYIVNSLVILTVSSTLLVLQGDDESTGTTKVSKKKYIIGFICTVGASAGYALALSLTQLVFTKVIRRETFRVVMNMILWQSVCASSLILVGLFVSGEWKSLTKEMEGFQLGKVSYVMNLTWTAITWQIFSIGIVGLVFEASSLFSNSISAVGLPIVPVAAVIFFHEKMDGIKLVSMFLAIWGFSSYVYQHYLDDQNSKTAKKDANDQVSTAFPLENVNG